MPDLSRRMVVALVAVVAGLTFIVLALVGGSGASNGSGGNETNEAIEPVAPLGADADEKRTKDDDTVKDVKDPFATGYGSQSSKKVTITVTANGPGRVGIRYRKGAQKVRIFRGSYTETRTVKSKYPVAQVATQSIPPSTRGTCSITIDGVEVSRYTTTKRFGVLVCLG